MHDIKSQLTILNPRPDSTANRQLIKQLNDLHLSHIHIPAITLQKTNNSLPKSAIDNCELVIFTSQAAIEFGLKPFQEKLATASTLIAAIGDSTKARLEEKGFTKVITGKKANSEALFDKLKNSIANKSIILIKGEGGRDFLPEKLKNISGDLTVFCPYKRLPAPFLTDDLQKKLHQKKIDFVLATSIDVCQSLLTHTPNKDILETLKNATWVCLSSRIKLYLEKIGMKKILVTEEHLFSTIEKITT